MSDDDQPSYDRAAEELKNVHDPGQRAMVLAMLAITEELVIVGDSLRSMADTARKLGRLSGWMKR